MQYSLPDQKELGHEACEFRDAYFAEVGSRYGWASAFLAQRCHIDDMRLPAAKAMCKQLRGAVRTADGEGLRAGEKPARKKVIGPHQTCCAAQQKETIFGPT